MRRRRVVLRENVVRQNVTRGAGSEELRVDVLDMPERISCEAPRIESRVVGIAWVDETGGAIAIVDLQDLGPRRHCACHAPLSRQASTFLQVLPINAVQEAQLLAVGQIAEGTHQLVAGAVDLRV